MSSPKQTDREIFNSWKKSQKPGAVNFTEEDKNKLQSQLDMEMEIPEITPEENKGTTPLPVPKTIPNDWQKPTENSKFKKAAVRGYRPKDSRQVTHNLRRRMGR